MYLPFFLTSDEVKSLCVSVRVAVCVCVCSDINQALLSLR